MCLIKQSDKPTMFVLPVMIKTKSGVYPTNRYYDNEYILFKAYHQLRAIKGNIVPSYPVIYT